MQIVLIIITGFSIALSPIIKRGIDSFTRHINSPTQVYFLVVLIGLILTLISFGWVVITCVLARELALRVKGVHYPFLIGCVYISSGSWVSGLSSSIPLLLNTKNNFLINSGVLSEVIPTSYTLGSILNIVMIITTLIVVPLILVILRPRKTSNKEISDLIIAKENSNTQTIKEDMTITHINEVVLNRIIINEYSKSYLTKEVDSENKEGYFVAYKRVVKRLSEIINAVSPHYEFPSSLASTIVEGALHQHFLKNYITS